MKPLRSISAALVIAFLLTSCVSNRKYNAALSEKDDWKTKTERMMAKFKLLEKEMATMREEKEKLQASSSEALFTKQKQLKEKDVAIKDREQKIQELLQAMTEQRDAILKLKQEVCSALKCFSPEELTVEVRDGKLYVSMSDKLLFPSGSDIVNTRGREAIGMLAAVLSNSNLEIMVEGHTDNVPIHTERNKDNWDLSAHRATSVARILNANGIPAARIISSGRGEFHPLATNASAEGRQQNRRTEIVLAPRLDKLWELTEEGDADRAMK